ncbi:MAG: metallophosphoesterase [Defluviitaleaceae bacterium]|nr:metallophosphoesterase [Defluviitaleaceae bacterium]
MLFLKKIIWPCYIITFALLAVILLWGLSGVLGGGGHAQRLFSFYAIIPAVLFISGGLLGFKDAYMKWLYPVLFGFLTRMVVLQFASLQVGLTLLPFLVAFSGMIFGITGRMIVQGLTINTQMKLKKMAQAVGIIAGAIALIHIAHAATLDRIIEYKAVTFSSPNIPVEMNGYRIAFVADTHSISASRLKEVVNELNTRHLDLLILGGDFPSTDGAEWRSMEILSQTITADGILGVEGNHDNYADLFAAKEAHGIVPLSNSGVLVRDHFFLAGVEDLWNRNPDIAAAIANAGPDDFVLLVSHNPDVSMRQDTTGVDLILSGHTHGGQITFFGIWAPYFTFRNTITDYGQRFVSGWAKSRDGMPVLVSTGTGEYLPRVFARPQVILLTLISER